MAATADYLNNLIIQRNALADNLVVKGVEATHDELFDTLVPKVLDIKVQNSGIKGGMIELLGIVTGYTVGAITEKEE